MGEKKQTKPVSPKESKPTKPPKKVKLVRPSLRNKKPQKKAQKPPTGAKIALKIRKKAMLAALRQSMGIVSAACEAADVSRYSHYEWLKKDKTYAAQVESIEEKSIDFAESKLLQLIKGVQLPDSKVHVVKGKIVVTPLTKHLAPDTAAVTFYLRTKGKKRGFGNELDITTKGKPITAPPAPGVIIMLDDGTEPDEQ